MGSPPLAFVRSANEGEVFRGCAIASKGCSITPGNGTSECQRWIL